MKIFGHKKQQEQLQQDLAAENLAHAYLFSGPPQVGKYSLARWMAKVLQCPAGGCNDCVICLHIEKGYHGDTIEIAGDQLITIGLLRGVLMSLNTTTTSRYKILLIKNIEHMQDITSHTFLKYLEEPAAAVKFFLTSSTVDSVLPTILSRVRTIKFQLLSPGEILKMLQEKYPLEDAGKLAEVTDLAFGMPGRAVQLMENEELLTRSRLLLVRMKNVLQRGDVVEKFALVDEVTKDKKDDPQYFREFCDIFLLALRHRMLEGAANGAQDLARTADVITKTQRLLRLQKNNINARLAFENLMLQV